MTLRERARASIDEVRLEHDGMDRKQLRKLCSDGYPFDERSGFAYKAWLAEMREIFGRTRPVKNDNQGDMFNG